MYHELRKRGTSLGLLHPGLRPSSAVMENVPRRIAFMPRGNEFNAGLDQSVRDLEIGRTKQTETSARAEVRKVSSQD